LISRWDPRKSSYGYGRGWFDVGITDGHSLQHTHNTSSKKAGVIPASCNERKLELRTSRNWPSVRGWSTLPAAVNVRLSRYASETPLALVEWAGTFHIGAESLSQITKEAFEKVSYSFRNWDATRADERLSTAEGHLFFNTSCFSHSA